VVATAGEVASSLLPDCGIARSGEAPLEVTEIENRDGTIFGILDADARELEARQLFARQITIILHHAPR